MTAENERGEAARAEMAPHAFSPDGYEGVACVITGRGGWFCGLDRSATIHEGGEQ